MSFTVRRLANETKKNPFPWKRLALAALKVAGPLLTLVEILHKRNVAEKKHRQRVHMLKRMLVVLIAIFLAVFLFAETVNALFRLNILSLRSIVSVAAESLPTDAYGHTNILLLGKGDATHDGIDLTDTMMVASLDPEKTKSAVMLSIPRDMYLLATEHMGKGKINTMYRDYKTTLIRQGKTKEEASRLAMTEVGQELGKALGVQIHEVMMVDFTGFTQAVDAVGGVDVDVAQDLIDTQYPADETSYTTFSINAGHQHLDGETALKYARSRHSTSDFDRSRRQQQILHAIADRVKSEHLLTKPNQILDLLNILKTHIDTTMSVRQLLGLGSAALAVNQQNILSMQLNDRNGLYGSIVEQGGFLYTPPRDQFKGESVLLPISIPPMPVTWKQIQMLVHLLVDTRTPILARSPIDVLNAGAVAGSSRKLGSELRRYGFVIDQMANAPGKPKNPHSVVQAHPEHKDVAAFIAGMLKIPLEVEPAAAATETTDSASIDILLGKDYTFATLQSLLPPQ